MHTVVPEISARVYGQVLTRRGVSVTHYFTMRIGVIIYLCLIYNFIVQIYASVPTVTLFPSVLLGLTMSYIIRTNRGWTLTAILKYVLRNALTTTAIHKKILKFCTDLNISCKKTHIDA